MCKIIAFEGIDGVGKTTHINSLSSFLKKQDIPHLVTQELYGDDLRGAIRKILVSKENMLDGYEELLLISLARRWHYANIIEPALAQNALILMDRFIASTWAYQGGGRGVPESILKFFQENIWAAANPDLTIYLEGSSHRQNKSDRFEQESDNFFSDILHSYKSQQDKRWRIFYAQDNFDLIQGMIREEVMYFLNKDDVLINESI